MSVAALGSPGRIGFLAAALAVNAGIGASVARGGVGPAVIAALAPVVVVGVGLLLSQRTSVLVVAALAVPISQHALNKPYPLAGGISIWVSDVIVGLALASWIAVRLVGGRLGPAPRLKTPVLGWPFVLFAGVVLVAVLRGNAYHGLSLVGAPTRLVLYAGIAAAIAGLTARDIHRALTFVFYPGVVWMMLNAAYYLATGTSQTESVELSTGGSRVLSGTVSAYMGLGLVLALLNLRISKSAGGRALHLSIAALALTGVVLGYSRAVFVPVALVLVVLLLNRGIARTAAGLVPLAVPFVALIAIALPRVAPDIVPQFVDRVSAGPSTDANVRWRRDVSAQVWKQVHESPLTGVGFGKSATVSMPAVSSSGLVIFHRETIGQEGHNDYLWLLASGGVLALGSFLLLLAVYVLDVIRKLRSAVDDHERTVLAWSALGLAILLVPALAAPVLGAAPIALGVWTLLLLPAVVPVRRRRGDILAAARSGD